MAEQIKFELDSDEALGILQESSDAESKLGKECWKTGLKEDAMKHFKNEAAFRIASNAVNELVSVKPIKIIENRVYKCKSCSYHIACVPNATKPCDQCGQSFYWEEQI